MTGPVQRCHVVAMVDLRPDSLDKDMEQNFERRLNYVRSCCLKLLTYFSNKVPSSTDDSFQWGFKFYNSVTPSKGDRWGFESFTSKTFELFESRLEERFEQECMKRDSIRRSCAKLMTEEYDNTPRARLPRGPSKVLCPPDDDDRSSQLKTGLKQVCEDFMWEVSDPNSPNSNKQARNRRRTATAESSSQNILLVFSSCPHSMDDLKKFAECDGKNLNAVLYSFMPDILVKELHVKRKIKLYWIDISSVQEKPDSLMITKSAIEGMKILDDTLKLVGGSVVPAGAIMQLGSVYTSLLCPVMEQLMASQHDTQGDHKQDAAVALPLPVSSVMDYYCKKDESAPSSCEAYLELSFPDSTEKILERIEIHQLYKACESSAVLEENAGEEDRRIQLTISQRQKAEGDGVANTRASCTVKVGARQPASVAWKLQGQGCISAIDLPLTALHHNTAYVVTPKTGVDRHGYLEPLLASLAHYQQVLVVECMDSNNQIPVCGILQPLSGASASLTLIKSPFLPVLEKLLAFGKPTSTQSHPSSIKNFIAECSASILQSVIPHPPTTVSKSTSDEQCKELDTEAVASFDPSMFEHWFNSSAAHNNKLIDNIKEGNTTTKMKEHKRLMKMLKQHYKEQKDKPLCKTENTAKALRRSPRKTPRKISGKSPLKSPAKATRKSPRKALLQKNKVVVMDRHRSFTAPASSRSTMIFQRSKSTQQQSPRKNTKSQSASDKPGKKQQAPSVDAADFKDTADLVQHLLALYNQNIDSKGNALDCAQTMLNIAHCYMQANQENAVEELDKVFSDYILQTNNQLRDKYSDPQLQVCDEYKAAEFELQILLQMELESLVRTENEELMESKVQQVVTKLRTLAFIKDTNHLNEFISRTLLDNYLETQPKMLVMMFEELLLPLPLQLEAYGEDEDAMSSVQPPSNASSNMTDPRSALSTDDLNSVRTNRSRKSLSTFPSFSLSSQRQIAVPGKAKTKERKIMTRSAKKRSVSKQKEKTKAEMRKVRRNLFDQANKKESSHVPTTPKRTSQRLAATTPKAHHILKTRIVEETPKHKQVAQALWRRQESYRKRAHTEADVMVVQESPDKSVCDNQSEGAIRTPGRLIGGNKRKSFYSDAPDKQSRSMTRFKESRSIEASQADQCRYKLLEARMSGKSPNRHQLPEKQFSPRRIKPMCLFAHLLSPSPNKPPSQRSTPASARRRLDISVFDSPSKNTRSHGSLSSSVASSAAQSPFKQLPITPGKCARLESLFAGRSFSQGTPAGHGKTPLKTPKRTRTSSVGHPSPKTPSKRQCKQLFQTPKKGIPETPQKELGEALTFNELVMSPNRLTRSQAKTATPRMSCSVSEKIRTPRKVVKQVNSVSPSSQTVEEELLSPRRSQRLQDTSYSTPTKSADPVPRLTTTPKYSGKENSTTPKVKSKVKTPESLDKWPRRKRRITLNPSGDSPESPDEGNKGDSAKAKHLDCVRSTLGSSARSPFKSLSSATPQKRKRDTVDHGESSQGFDSEPAPVIGTPLKKLRFIDEELLKSEEISTDYFSSTEVFLNDSERPSQHREERLVHPRIRRFQSGGSDSASNMTSEPPSSPVFQMAPHLLSRQSSTLSHPSWSDNDCESLSPVFRKTVDSIIDSIESDPETSPEKTTLTASPVLGSPSKNYRKFSPNVSAKSLAHLMTSPLVTDKCSRQAPHTDSPTKFSVTPRPSSPTTKPSRRSLYQNRTQSNM